MFVFNKTCIGYNHIISNKECQDHSLSFVDQNKMIIATCDGHGGDIYIRSSTGSRLACEAALNVLKNLTFAEKTNFNLREILNKLKLDILCEWNRLVENDFVHRPFMDYELKELDKQQIKRLEDNYVIAYGTTMHAVLVTEGIITCVSIGDGGIFLIKPDKFEEAFVETNEENVANITTSLCSDNAYEYINVDIFPKAEYDGVFCLTDGVINPYQNYFNFEKSFIIPVVKEIRDKKEIGVENVKKFIYDLGINKGIGDDVSFAMIYGGEVNEAK